MSRVKRFLKKVNWEAVYYLTLVALFLGWYAMVCIVVWRHTGKG